MKMQGIFRSAKLRIGGRVLPAVGPILPSLRCQGGSIPQPSPPHKHLKFRVLIFLMGVVKNVRTRTFFTTLLMCLAVTAFAKAPQTDWEAYKKSGSKAVKWNPLVEAGFQAFEGENFQVSLRFLERATLLGCGDGLVIYKLAKLKELQGNYKRALELLKNAEEPLNKYYPVHPATLGLSEQIGGIYFQAGQYDEALNYYLAALLTSGDNFLRNFLVGQMLRMKGEKETAISYFEKSLQFPPPEGSPKNMKSAAKVELLQLYYGAEQWENALEMANEILAEDPGNQTALALRANLQNQRVKEKEKKEWKRILEKY